MYYVYVLARPNGKPFYVGKGKNDRLFAHEREARSECRCHKCNVIRKIWRTGKQVQRFTVLTTEDEAEAYAYERELIALYGRDTLCNQTNGGEGGASIGRAISDETRAKLSQKLKGRKNIWPLTDAGRARIAEASRRRKGMPGKPHSEETKAKMRAAHKGKAYRGRGFTASEETRQKMREALKGRPHPWHAGKPHSEETKAKMRASAPKGPRPERRKDYGVTYVLTGPDGVTHITSDFPAFCAEHGLRYYAFRRILLQGGRYKGWRARRQD